MKQITDGLGIGGVVSHPEMGAPRVYRERLLCPVRSGCGQDRRRGPGRSGSGPSTRRTCLAYLRAAASSALAVEHVHLVPRAFRAGALRIGPGRRGAFLRIGVVVQVLAGALRPELVAKLNARATMIFFGMSVRVIVFFFFFFFPKK